MYCVQSMDQAPIYSNIPYSNNKISETVIAEMWEQGDISKNHFRWRKKRKLSGNQPVGNTVS